MHNVMLPENGYRYWATAGLTECYRIESFGCLGIIPWRNQEVVCDCWSDSG